MIIFENVSKIYNDHIVALDNVNFEIRKGEFVSIVGRSGAGKSTILKLLINEERPTSGRIFIDNEEVNKIHINDLPRLRRKIGSIFQDYRLLPSKTVYENVAFAMEVAGNEPEEIRKITPQVLELVGLLDKSKNFPHELSGGEKQRVAIARAIVNGPEILMADEPTGNLDIYNTWEIIRLLVKINQLGTTVILATHDREIINAINKRVITLENGKVIRDEENGKYII